VEGQFFLQGNIEQHYTKKPLPFACILINGSDTCFMADGQGNFRIENRSPIRTVRVTAPLHRPFEIHIPDTFDDSKPLTISLIQVNLFEFSKRTDTYQDNQIRDNFLNNTLFHNPEYGKPYQCYTYNKFAITTERIGELKNKLNKLAGKFDFINKRITDTTTNHHLMLLESVTKKEFVSRKYQKETLLASRVSGVEKPSTFAIMSQFQPFTLYEPELHIAGKTYYSPTIKKATKWYEFQIEDTINTYTENGSERLYLLKFYPKYPRRADFVKGFLWIGTDDYAIRYTIIEPSIHLSEYKEFIQSYKKLPSCTWFPYYTASAIYYDRYATANNKTVIRNESVVYEVEFKSFPKQYFNHIQINFKDSLPVETPSESYWESIRKLPFRKIDANTYQFYEEVGNIKSLERITNFGEALVYGEIPAGEWNILMNKIIDFNEFEGLRLGFGGVTNQHFSRYSELGAYVGYGLNDNIFKYGGWAKWHIWRKNQTFLEAKRIRDVREAADVGFAMDKLQFHKESMRRFRVRYMDKFTDNEIALQTRLFRYFSVRTAIGRTFFGPQYNYEYENKKVITFQTTEYRFAIKYAPDEYFLQSLYRQISLGNKLPIFWVQYAQSTSEWGKNDFDYRKIDIKFQYTTKILGWGLSALQIRLGKVWGQAPYSLLYNGRGSYRPLAAIAHNSFETMLYNEFLSDRHLSIHFAHRFGTLNIRQFKKQPSLLMCHNIGFGNLTNKEAHQIDIPYKTMKHGFFESGLYLNNIFVIKLPGLQTGLGAGVFSRWGAYSYPNPMNNIVFKLAVEVQL